MTTDYIRRQDVVDAINANADGLEQNGGIPYAQGARAMAIVVEQMPPVDVAKIIRCGNCKYHSYDEVFCCYWCEHEGMVREVKPDFYCGYGEE